MEVVLLESVTPMSESVKAQGRPRQRPEGEQGLTIRLPKKVHRVLRLIAAAEGISLNEALTLAASSWIETRPNYRTYENLAEQALDR